MNEEPQTLDAATDMAFGEQQEVISKESVAEQPESTSEQSLPQQQATKEVAEESYTRIDPKTLPPELQGVHKSLLRDYTKKTQEIARQRKELEQLKQQSQQPQVQGEANNGVEHAEKSGIHPGMTLEEYNAYILSQLEERLTAKQQQELQDQEDKYLENAVAEFESADERLNSESPAYDEHMRNAVGVKLDELLNEFRQKEGTAIGFDYQGKTKELVESYEKYMEDRAKELSQKKTKEAFSSVKRTAPHSIQGSQAPSKPAGSMSLDESLDAAFSQQ